MLQYFECNYDLSTDKKIQQTKNLAVLSLIYYLLVNTLELDLPIQITRLSQLIMRVTIITDNNEKKAIINRNQLGNPHHLFYR